MSNYLLIAAFILTTMSELFFIHCTNTVLGMILDTYFLYNTYFPVPLQLYAWNTIVRTVYPSHLRNYVLMSF